MKRIYTFLLACLCVIGAALSARAQSDFKPGFVVLASGDTLTGLVDYRANVLSSKVCRFKSKESASVVLYSPNDISSYGFPEDRYYASKYVKADSSRVFMEELVRSKINLYNLKGRFYVEKEGLGLEELETEFREYYNDAGVLHRTSANKHTATLNKYMDDCILVMVEKTERVALAQSSLIRLIKDYNECSPGVPVVVFKEDQPWFAAEFGVGVGVTHTSLSFSAKDERYLHLEHSDFTTSTYPTVGLLLNLRSPRVSKFTSVQLEGHYFRASHEDRNAYEWAYMEFENEMELRMSAVKLSTAVRHEFGSKKLQPYVNAGMFFNFFQDRDLKHNQYVRRTVWREPEVRVKDDPEFITKNQKGFMIGAGLLYGLAGGKVAAEARYEHGLDVHHDRQVDQLNARLSSNTSNISLLVGYYF
ncbi:porin family protein [Pontibacter flavimaris]|uniref:Uncharacterized protein n=1 Tax=Pontibacter flavimaris TaxID=1797110 RepID=A0A1Q5PEN3_9BACT|nr:outer membrane beta-barrel protein [Pontibacter flavimaris]OKL40684.1 hypothetical protein A3841_12555 [Pontibacter flavimaris]